MERFLGVLFGLIFLWLLKRDNVHFFARLFSLIFVFLTGKAGAWKSQSKHFRLGFKPVADSNAVGLISIFSDLHLGQKCFFILNYRKREGVVKITIVIYYA